MPALLVAIGRLALSTAAWVAVEKAFEYLIDKDDSSYIDEILGLFASVVAFKSGDITKLARFFRSMPAPVNTLTGKNIETAEDAANYLKAILDSKKAREELNTKLGGYAPLVVSLLTKMQNLFTLKGKVKLGMATAIVSIPTFIIWLPSLISNYMDQGVFAPEQANKIFEALGLPFRWPVSDVRATQTALEAEKLEYYQGKDSGTGGSGGSGDAKPLTIIRMTEEKKPQQFLGTLFSAKLDKVEQFDRKVDDEITDMEDLIADVKVNLNRWLKSFPGRLGYSVSVRKDPVDEYGVQQSGIWATLTLMVTHISGKTTPIDTILLGPVNPQMRLELVKSSKVIESQIPGLISGQEVREIEVPNGIVDIFTPDGERASPSSVYTAPTETSAPTETVTSKKSGESDSDYRARLEKTAKELQQQVDNQQKSQSSVAGKYIVAGTGGSGLNVRSEPSTNSRILGTLKEGEVFNASGPTSVAEGFTWYKGNVNGRISADNVWVASQYLQKV
jgi:hypothetical protein